MQMCRRAKTIGLVPLLLMILFAALPVSGDEAKETLEQYSLSFLLPSSLEGFLDFDNVLTHGYCPRAVIPALGDRISHAAVCRAFARKTVAAIKEGRAHDKLALRDLSLNICKAPITNIVPHGTEKTLQPLAANTKVSTVVGAAENKARVQNELNNKDTNALFSPIEAAEKKEAGFNLSEEQLRAGKEGVQSWSESLQAYSEELRREQAGEKKDKQQKINLLKLHKEAGQQSGVSYYLLLSAAFLLFTFMVALALRDFLLLKGYSLQKLINKKQVQSGKTKKHYVANDEFDRLIDFFSLSKDASELEIRLAFEDLVRQRFPDIVDTGWGEETKKLPSEYLQLKRSYERLLEIREARKRRR